jgi:hypothetical protein
MPGQVGQRREDVIVDGWGWQREWFAPMGVNEFLFVAEHGREVLDGSGDEVAGSSGVE